MMVTRYVIKEAQSTSVGDLLKAVFAVISTAVIFQTTLYMGSYSASRNSICRSQSDVPEIENHDVIKKLVAADKRAIMVGYMEFERSYLIEHVLNPLTLTRRIFPLNAKFISQQSSGNNLQNNVTLVAHCAELIFQFETISARTTNTMSEHSLRTLEITIPADLVKMDWRCQVKNFDLNFPINASYSNDKRTSYPCFRSVNLPRGSKGIAATLYIQKISISLNDK